MRRGGAAPGGRRPGVPSERGFRARRSVRTCAGRLLEVLPWGLVKVRVQSGLPVTDQAPSWMRR